MKRLAVLVASLTLGAGVLVLGPVSTAVASPDSIAVCCAWNSELADGQLTYRIAGGESTVQGLIRTAIEKWDTAVNGLMLDEVSGPANIEVRFKKGGGVVQGLAIRRFQKIGNDFFIRAGKVTISGAFRGTPNDTTAVQIITEQEFGHALGIDHADFTGDVMFGDLSGAAEGISTCDADAVIAANQWKLDQNLSTPAPPLVDHVDC
jgi:predicted Zn-dependent protease